MHRFCSSLTKFSSTKSLQTRFVAPHNRQSTLLVIEVISNDKFIAIYTLKRNLGNDLVFLIFTDKNLANNKNLGLREKITKNMINI